MAGCRSCFGSVCISLGAVGLEWQLLGSIAGEDIGALSLTGGVGGPTINMDADISTGISFRANVFRLRVRGFPAMNVKTPLNAWHHAHGGRMVDFAGAELPVLFTSIVQEHQAVRADAGWFDVSHRGRFLLKGPDAVAWLEKLATCKVGSLVKGQVRYG